MKSLEKTFRCSLNHKFDGERGSRLFYEYVKAPWLMCLSWTGWLRARTKASWKTTRISVDTKCWQGSLWRKGLAAKEEWSFASPLAANASAAATWVSKEKHWTIAMPKYWPVAASWNSSMINFKLTHAAHLIRFSNQALAVAWSWRKIFCFICTLVHHLAATHGFLHWPTRLWASGQIRTRTVWGVVFYEPRSNQAKVVNHSKNVLLINRITWPCISDRDCSGSHQNPNLGRHHPRWTSADHVLFG